jgi:hypothetical protein
MPQRKLFNLKNSGSWVSIKKKQNYNSEAETADKENACEGKLWATTSLGPTQMLGDCNWIIYDQP